MGERTASARSRGVRGEDAAAVWLAEHGYAILARNFRSRSGEIDIVTEKEGALAFVEVKSWRSYGAADLEYAIGAEKQRRIASAARYFLSRRPDLAGRALRFDVLLLRAGHIEHIENAFSGSVD
ncbi:MAG: YraN family protein [Spirochaetes bacterium]|nr:YraN family protein [Spirochaetota bacterium]